MWKKILEKIINDIKKDRVASMTLGRAREDFRGRGKDGRTFDN